MQESIARAITRQSREVVEPLENWIVQLPHSGFRRAALE
jgi:hypothetical protein